MRKFWIILCQFFVLAVNAQETFIGGTVHYMFQFPFGDIADHYSPNSNVGLNLNIKLANNFTFGAEGQFLFSGRYKNEKVLGDMITSGGFVIGEGNNIEMIELEGRGAHFFMEAGKIFPLNNINKNSGLHIKAGLGYCFYSAYNNANVKSITQLQGEYLNGYNQYESGLTVNGFFGYTLYSKNKLINGSIGLQIIYASTKFQGALDYATGLVPDQSSRTSLFVGPKLGITVVLMRFMKADPKSDGYFYN